MSVGLVPKPPNFEQGSDKPGYEDGIKIKAEVAA